MSQREAGNNWIIYTADTGAVLAVDQVEKDGVAIWWLTGTARGDICALLEADLKVCAARVDLLVLALKDVNDISSECLHCLVRLQKEVLDPRNGELRLANANGAVAEKLSQLRIHLALSVTTEDLKQPKTDRPAVNTAVQPLDKKKAIPTDYLAVTIEDNATDVTVSETVVSATPGEAPNWLLINRHNGAVYCGMAEDMLVGRNPDCGICLPMPSISRQHLKIFRSEGLWYVQDLGSSFGTRLDDQPLQANVPVALERCTAVLHLSRYSFDLVLKPYCDLINLQDAAEGPVCNLVHEGSGEFLCMTGTRLPLGRKFAPAHSAMLRSPVISGCHAEIRREADGWYLMDTNSTNGTYLDDVLLNPQEPVRLANEACIRLGSKEKGETFRWAEVRGEN